MYKCGLLWQLPLKDLCGSSGEGPFLLLLLLHRLSLQAGV